VVVHTTPNVNNNNTNYNGFHSQRRPSPPINTDPSKQQSKESMPLLNKSSALSSSVSPPVVVAAVAVATKSQRSQRSHRSNAESSSSSSSDSSSSDDSSSSSSSDSENEPTKYNKHDHYRMDLLAPMSARSTTTAVDTADIPLQLEKQATYIYDDILLHCHRALDTDPYLLSLYQPSYALDPVNVPTPPRYRASRLPYRIRDSTYGRPLAPPTLRQLHGAAPRSQSVSVTVDKLPKWWRYMKGMDVNETAAEKKRARLGAKRVAVKPKRTTQTPSTSSSSSSSSTTTTTASSSTRPAPNRFQRKLQAQGYVRIDIDSPRQPTNTNKSQQLPPSRLTATQTKQREGQTTTNNNTSNKTPVRLSELVSDSPSVHDSAPPPSRSTVSSDSPRDSMSGYGYTQPRMFLHPSSSNNTASSSSNNAVKPASAATIQQDIDMMTPRTRKSFTIAQKNKQKKNETTSLFSIDD
jgi:hypothetical protein